MRASVVLEMPVKGTRPGPINVSDPTSPARDPSSPTSRSPQKSVEDILKEKREAQEALLRVASELSSALLSLGIDSANPKPGQTGSKVRLPLSYFDNLDLERDTPESHSNVARQAATWTRLKSMGFRETVCVASPYPRPTDALGAHCFWTVLQRTSSTRPTVYVRRDDANEEIHAFEHRAERETVNAVI